MYFFTTYARIGEKNSIVSHVIRRVNSRDATFHLLRTRIDAYFLDACLSRWLHILSNFFVGHFSLRRYRKLRTKGMTTSVKENRTLELTVF